MSGLSEGSPGRRTAALCYCSTVIECHCCCSGTCRSGNGHCTGAEPPERHHLRAGKSISRGDKFHHTYLRSVFINIRLEPTSNYSQIPLGFHFNFASGPTWRSLSWSQKAFSCDTGKMEKSLDTVDSPWTSAGIRDSVLGGPPRPFPPGDACAGNRPGCDRQARIEGHFVQRRNP